MLSSRTHRRETSKNFAMGLCVKNMIQDSNKVPTDDFRQETSGVGEIQNHIGR